MKTSVVCRTSSVPLFLLAFLKVRSDYWLSTKLFYSNKTLTKTKYKNFVSRAIKNDTNSISLVVITVHIISNELYIKVLIYNYRALLYDVIFINTHENEFYTFICIFMLLLIYSRGRNTRFNNYKT